MFIFLFLFILCCWLVFAFALLVYCSLYYSNHLLVYWFFQLCIALYFSFIYLFIIFKDYWQIIRKKIYELLATVLDYERLGLFICSRMLRNLESMIFIKWLSSGINLLLLLTSWLVNSALKWLHKLPD